MGCFDENDENDEFTFYPLKTRASLLRPPKTTKMTKMAGVTQEKAWFRKSRVCSSLNVWNDRHYFLKQLAMIFDFQTRLQKFGH